ncbi:DUF4114 domain-containing protein [Corallococcus aberystwythensis]|uniref:DUF4114 domain-containing protein n=1 Tax=Corallococcus aberystwythensis TaxID=2316722 RepID=A0A3A8PST5_9BACT|nr:DUF4114 domain-containing protein [Corallococcus aberystwythensis]RKH56755.1 DUF4114 domain-containing protein [Corallococcus aberystwythensis]
MPLNRFPLLALVAGSAVCVIASPRSAQAAGTPKAVYLPPQLTSATQSTSALCDFDYSQSLDTDHQPDFTPWGFDELTNLVLTNEGWLSLNLHLGQLSSERIVFPNEQHLSVTFVHESSGASHSLGYLYYDDLVARGYVDTRGTPGDSSDDALVDANGNGVADLHEDLYNLAPPTGFQARPYVGTGRRCASRTFTSQGLSFTMPDLALNANCTAAFSRQSLPDARPGTHPFTTVDVVGSSPFEGSPVNATGYSDQGLYSRIPNLLEPAHASNNLLGLGHLLFLLADDDAGQTTFNQLGTVPDTDFFEDGIPDYDVSRYDAHGLLRPVNPDPGITPQDRTVDLGTLPAGKELVFFLVTQSESIHDVDDRQVYPCLRKAMNGQCLLHLRTPINVFFSKAKWNLDQDPVGRIPVAQRNTGCAYTEQCNADQPQTQATACTLANSSLRLCGWLDAETLLRLRHPDYGGFLLPMAAASVAPSDNGNMPHLLLNAPPMTHGQWLMGFEDLPGGADRDFNDVVFLLRGVTEGRVRSRVLSPDDASCRIAQVSFQKSDDLGLYCAPQTSITYALATDCNLCDGGACVPNPTPTWHPLSLPGGTASTTVDVSSTPGQQLCWKAEVTPKGDFLCQPTIRSVDVGYLSEPVMP